jgi:sterol desaturase/sphingolipid hydroxylase (fatty acid hydroxylase superfamily)
MTNETHAAAVFESRDFPAFHRAFLRLPEIRLYAVLAVASAAVALWAAESVWQLVLPVVLVVVLYPGIEYLLHRYVLHNLELAKTPLTAKMWWRLHYRHHSEPRDPEVILGAPWSLLLAVGVAAILVASIVWSLAALPTALFAGLVCALAYEYFHSLEHSRVDLRNRYLIRMRTHHLAHHYLNEQGNYGITSPIIDRLIGTTLKTGGAQPTSPTVRNLGYAGDLESQFPWVAEIERTRHPEERPSAAE